MSLSNIIVKKNIGGVTMVLAKCGKGGRKGGKGGKGK